MSDGIRFLIILMGIPAVIVQMLRFLSCGCLGFFFLLLLLLSIKDLREFTCPNWLLESRLCLEIFLQNPPQDIS